MSNNISRPRHKRKLDLRSRTKSMDVRNNQTNLRQRGRRQGEIINNRKDINSTCKWEKPDSKAKCKPLRIAEAYVISIETEPTSLRANPVMNNPSKLRTTAPRPTK
ncbi:hypothetical protein ACOSQ3_007650 [Xanthoceras sorbifolium]